MPVSVPDASLTKDRRDRHDNSRLGTPVSEMVVEAFFQACPKRHIAERIKLDIVAFCDRRFEEISNYLELD